MTDLADLLASVAGTVRGLNGKVSDATDCITDLHEERQCYAKLEEAVALLEETSRSINTRLATIAHLMDKMRAGTLPDPARPRGQTTERNDTCPTSSMSSSASTSHGTGSAASASGEPRNPRSRIMDHEHLDEPYKRTPADDAFRARVWGFLVYGGIALLWIVALAVLIDQPGLP